VDGPSRDDFSLPERLTGALGRSAAAGRIGAAQEAIYGPVIDWARRTPLHSGTLGHSVHPMLTDVTLGCWLSAAILDIAGGPASRPAATVLTAAGLAAAVPTAFAGAADWSETEGEEHRIGAVHALGTDAATFLFLGSLIARLRGRHAAGVRLGLAGNAVAAAAGFLGGHLALNRGTARRSAAAV